MPWECQELDDAIAEHEGMIIDLQEQLTTAPPSHKNSIATRIRELNTELADTRERYRTCVLVNPKPEDPSTTNSTTDSHNISIEEDANELARLGLFLRHPRGDATNLPCTHFVQAHPLGHEVRTPCTHLVPAHPDGDYIPRTDIKLPCIHLVPAHPEGHEVTIPCVHLVPAHPEGDPGPVIPCVHPMIPTRIEFSNGLLFYTNNTSIQNAMMGAVRRLGAMGIRILWPRPIHIFHRGLYDNNNRPNKDPFWSHYNPVFHSIQILNHPNYRATAISTLYHELGHALVGHSLVKAHGGGGHEMLKESAPEVAMSEGWAHFVGLVLTNSRNSTSPNYRGYNWEEMLDQNGDPVDPNPNIEFCVACCLWDLYDTNSDGASNPDSLSLSFSDIFRVYSINLETLTSGVIIDSIYSFLDRLKLLQPNSADLIDQVKERTVG